MFKITSDNQGTGIKEHVLGVSPL